MTTRLVLASLVLAASATTLTAQSLTQGAYIQGFVGASQLRDTTFSGIIGGAPQSVTGDFDTGYGIGLAIGREIPQWSNSNVGTRIELEFSYRDNDAQGLNFSGNGPGAETNVAGDVTSTSIFANVLFDLRQPGRWTPYAGLGLGATRSNLNLSYGPGVAINGDDTSFAMQAIAGVGYEVNDTTTLTLDARYSRAFGVSSPRLAPNGTVTGTVEDDLDAIGLNLGVRFNF